MKTAVSQLMIRLLADEISGAKPQKGELSLDEETLKELYLLASSHDLAGTVGDALLAAGAFPPESVVKKNFDKAAMTAIFRFERIRHTLEEIEKILSEAKIAHMPLKGSVLRDLYPDPAMRTSSDIDILVSERDVPAASAALVGKGYKQGPAETVYEVTFASPNGVTLELHYCLEPSMKEASEILSHVFETAKPAAEGSYTYLMSPAYFWFYHIAHAAKHFLSGGNGVRTEMDLYVMKRKMPVDGEVLKQMLTDAGLLVFADCLFRLEAYWFEGGDTDETVAEMGEYVLTGGIYGTVDSSAAAMGAQKGRFRAVLEYLFLPFSGMALQFPILKKLPILLPAFWVYRWFRAVFRGKTKSSVRLLRSKTTLKSAECDKVTALTKKLGL